MSFIIKYRTVEKRITDNQSNPLKIAEVKKTVWFGSNKFKNIVFENIKIYKNSSLEVQIVRLNDRQWKERILIKVIPDIKKRDIASISCNI